MFVKPYSHNIILWKHCWFAFELCKLQNSPTLCSKLEWKHHSFLSYSSSVSTCCFIHECTDCFSIYVNTTQLTCEQSRKQTGLPGDSVACIHARSCWGCVFEWALSSDWTESRKGSVSRARAVRSDPHSSRPSYIRELLRDIICLKSQAHKQTSWGTDYLLLLLQPDRECITVSLKIKDTYELQ